MSEDERVSERSERPIGTVPYPARRAERSFAHPKGAPMSERSDRTIGADDTPAEAALRAEARAFMEEHAEPYGRATRHLRLVDTPEFAATARAWQRTLAEGGWSVPTWPAELGGRDLSSNEARIVREEETRFAVPAGPFQVAALMVGPTLMACGAPEQQRRFLPAIRRGTTSGASCSPSPTPGPTSPASAPGRSATGTNGS